jgi:hypothetical protein
VAITSPAIHPSNAEPVQIRIGNIDSSARINAAPAMISGMLLASPKIKSATLPS